jgi:IMP dehydrogenase/GMP reductase
MIGGLFAEMEEACGPIIDEDYRGLKRRYRKFYGMASAQGQIDLNGAKTKTSEGTVKEYDIKYKLDSWCTNMSDYLRSAMSYCDAHTLEELSTKVDCMVISNNTYNSVNR